MGEIAKMNEIATNGKNSLNDKMCLPFVAFIAKSSGRNVSLPKQFILALTALGPSLVDINLTLARHRAGWPASARSARFAGTWPRRILVLFWFLLFLRSRSWTWSRRSRWAGDRAFSIRFPRFRGSVVRIWAFAVLRNGSFLFDPIPEKYNFSPKIQNLDVGN